MIHVYSAQLSKLFFLLILLCCNLQALAQSVDYIKGKEFEAKEDYERAIVCFNKCVKNNPGSVKYLNARGICFNKYNKAELSLQDFSKANQIQPGTKEIINNMGIALEYLNKYTEAIERYDEAIAIDDHFIESYFNKARTFEKLNNVDSAEANYKTVVRLNPQDKGAFVCLAMLYETKGQFEHAVDMQTVAIQIDSTDADLYYFRANDYDSLSKYELSILDYNTFLSKCKNQFDYTGLCRRGLAKEHLGNLTDALNDYNAAIEKDQKYKLGYVLRCKLYMVMNEMGKACLDYKTALKKKGTVNMEGLAGLDCKK